MSLLTAAKSGSTSECRLLLAAGGDVGESIYPTLFTPLHKAAINGQENNLILTQWRTVCQNCLIRTLPCSCLSPFLQASWRSSSKRLSILAASLGSAQTDLILRQFLLRHLAVKRQTHDQCQYLRFVHFIISGTLPETYTFSH